MLNRYALIKDGIVQNIALWDGVSDWPCGEGVTRVITADTCSPGDQYDAGTQTFIPQFRPEPLPEPDITGFISAVKAALGGIEEIASIPQSSMFYFALQQEEWADVKSLLQHAVATGSVSPAQVTAILTIAAQYHIPIPA